MARPYVFKKKEDVVAEAPKIEIKSQSEKEAEALQRKVLSDSLDAQKAKRDVQVRTVDNLERQIKDLQKEIDGLVFEFNQKKKINDGLGASIQSAHADLASLQAVFKDKNAKLLAEYDKKLADVRQADTELQSLVKSNNDLSKSLQREQSAFLQERESIRQQVHSMKSALDQNNAQWKVKEADLLERETSLKASKEEFEQYKESLQPEIARITAIKNENTLLIQKIEIDKQAMESMRLASIREKEAMEEAKLVSQAQAADEKKRILNEEQRLRAWEQNLKDSALEIKARQIEADKVLYRERLQAEVDKHNQLAAEGAK